MSIIHLLGGAFWYDETAGAPSSDPPTGPPTLPIVGTYGSPVKWNLSWTNGDPLAYTRIHRAAAGGSFASSTFIGSVNPGFTTLATSDETGGAEFVGGPSPEPGDLTYWLYHRRNGFDSTEISVDTVTV